MSRAEGILAAAYTFLFSQDDLRRNATYHLARYLFLQVENILKRTVVAFRPDVAAVLTINELDSDTDPLTSLTHAAFQDEADA